MEDFETVINSEIEYQNAINNAKAEENICREEFNVKCNPISFSKLLDQQALNKAPESV